MNLKVEDPSRVYYDKEQGLTMTGKKTFTGVKVTGYVRGQLNIGTLKEVLVEEKEGDKVSEPVKAEEDKKTPAQLKKEKAEAEAAAKKKEEA